MTYLLILFRLLLAIWVLAASGEVLAASGEFTNSFGEVLLLKACFLNTSYPTTIDGGHVLLRDETVMSFRDGLGRSRLRINFVPAICSDGNGAYRSSHTPKGAISGKRTWSGYWGELGDMIHDLINGPFSPKNILVVLNKTIEDPTTIAVGGGHVLLGEETVMSFGAGLGRSRLRSNFVPAICSDGNGACKTSHTPTWSAYWGHLVFWILFIFGVRCLDAQMGTKLLLVTLVCPQIMGCRATENCTRVVVEFQFCPKYCNTVPVSPSSDCCSELGAAASINEKNTYAPCTCYIAAEKDNGSELMCDTTKMVMLYEFCGVPVSQFFMKVALPPPATDKPSPKKSSLLATLWRDIKEVVYIVGSLLTLIATGMAIRSVIRYHVFNRPEDREDGIQMANIAAAAGELPSGSAT